MKPTRNSAAAPDGDSGRTCQISDTALALLWLAEGSPIADVLTMLEVRRRFEFSPPFARAYAVEILSAANAEIHLGSQPRITHRKELDNAAA